jgi:hypothetical protein
MPRDSKTRTRHTGLVASRAGCVSRWRAGWPRRPSHQGRANRVRARPPAAQEGRREGARANLLSPRRSGALAMRRANTDTGHRPRVRWAALGTACHVGALVEPAAPRRPRRAMAGLRLRRKGRNRGGWKGGRSGSPRWTNNSVDGQSGRLRGAGTAVPV